MKSTGLVLCSLGFAALPCVAADDAAAPKFPGAYAGYTLVAPTSSPVATLIDMDGKVVHTWQTSFPPASSTYLLENGNLLRTAASLGGRGGAGAGRAPGGAA